MKLVAFLSALCVVNARYVYEPIELDYHNKVGIPLASRLKAAEAATDFDGSRIVGGSISALGSHPYLGGLVIILNTGQTSTCGSSLLTNTRLVTAAHCWVTRNVQGRSMTVVLGSLNIFSGGLRVSATGIQVHGSYNMANLNNDVAIISISWVGYTNAINRVLMPSGSLLNNNYVGWSAHAAGYGRISDNLSVSNSVKREVTLNVMANNNCASIYGSSVVTASNICTSGAEGRAICDGDSGGPLVVVSGGNRILIGIVSFRPGAGCQSGLPSGYARATSFASWINARI